LTTINQSRQRLYIYFLNCFKTKTNVLLGCLAREVGFQLIKLMIPLLYSYIMFPINYFSSI